MKKIKFVDQLSSSIRRQYALWLELKTDLSGVLPMDASEWGGVQTKMLKKAVIERNFKVKYGIDINTLKSE